MYGILFLFQQYIFKFLVCVLGGFGDLVRRGRESVDGQDGFLEMVPPITQGFGRFPDEFVALLLVEVSQDDADILMVCYKSEIPFVSGLEVSGSVP